MHPELFLLIGISCSLGFTPGPNNAVASYSGFNFGIKKTIPLIMGVWLGYTVLVILINFVLISTFIKYPLIQEVIRILGTLFLLYLAKYKRNKVPNILITSWISGYLIKVDINTKLIKITNTV